MRLPVAAKMALQTAGAIPGVLASPIPDLVTGKSPGRFT